jgi:PII-like signaling protein
MTDFEGERDLLRIFIGERDKLNGKPLYHAIVELFRTNHFAGATVLRGIMGFGASAKLHTDRFDVLSLDMPIVVECVETAERIDAIMPELDRMVGGGLVTREKVRVTLHRPAAPTGS